VAGCFNATYCIHCPSRLAPLPACARRGEIKAFPLPHMPTKTYHIRLPCWRIYSFFPFSFFSLFPPSFVTSSDPCLPTSSSGEIFSLLRRSLLPNQTKRLCIPCRHTFSLPATITVFTISSYPSSTFLFPPDTSAVTHQI
jgi:hypothetical protein